MKATSYYLLIPLLLVTLACGTQAFPAPQPTVAPTLTAPPPTPTQAVPLSQTVTLTSVPFSEEGQAPPYKITAQTPNLTGSDDPRVQAFNSRMDELVKGEIAGFKKDTLQNASTPPLVAGSSFDVQYSLISQRGDFWSIKFQNMGFADGAAHPYHYSITVNYDLEKGKEITLDEIFIPNSSYLQVISDYCKAELTKSNIGFDTLFAQGADPTPENYQRWNVSTEGLIITFDEYQVAPYAAGPQTVAIPFDALGQIMERQGPLKPYLP